MQGVTQHATAKISSSLCYELTNKLMTESSKEQCQIPANDLLFKRYHDHEWGVPSDADQVFFEKICLEGFQSGLSWRTILHRRNGLRTAFCNFDHTLVKDFSATDIDRLMRDPSVIHNERKIRSVINNAQRFAELQRKGISLAGLCWSFEPDIAQRPCLITHQWLQDNSHTKESIALAKSLKALGWSFIGPTTIYATMQALGIVNDHVAGCPRKREIDRLRKTFRRPQHELT